MKLKPDYLAKPFIKFRKILDGFSLDPSTDEVHSLRTQSRRLEAIVNALALNLNKPTRRALKSIARMRKEAGRVRDMDVLINDVLALRNAPEEGSVVRLVEHLVKLRLKRARKLNDTVEYRRKETLENLKKCSKKVKEKIKAPGEITWNGMAAVQILITEVSQWPDLDEANLHAFRIRVKELRSMLQLSAGPDKSLLADLERTKDAIGTWHDCIELLRIARKVLDAEADRTTLNRIEAIRKKRAQFALAAAKATRKKYFKIKSAK